ncbi:hypothetical protein LT493_36885 [Streptomyces tricolor]|nr:hypothetical protein [Streptomyces tricolor]
MARLATNPLMCGLICALHRERRGYLPTGRKELYDAALTMLLAPPGPGAGMGASWARRCSWSCSSGWRTRWC